MLFNVFAPMVLLSTSVVGRVVESRSTGVRVSTLEVLDRINASSPIKWTAFTTDDDSEIKATFIDGTIYSAAADSLLRNPSSFHVPPQSVALDTGLASDLWMGIDCNTEGSYVRFSLLSKWVSAIVDRLNHSNLPPPGVRAPFTAVVSVRDKTAAGEELTILYTASFLVWEDVAPEMARTAWILLTKGDYCGPDRSRGGTITLNEEGTSKMRYSFSIDPVLDSCHC